MAWRTVIVDGVIVLIQAIMIQIVITYTQDLERPSSRGDYGCSFEHYLKYHSSHHTCTASRVRKWYADLLSQLLGEVSISMIF